MPVTNNDDQFTPQQVMGNLANALKEVDQEQAFNRCIVGAPVCNRSPIKAHAIPRTTLRLIADSDNEVVANSAIPPTHVPTYFNTSPLRKFNISQFSIGEWACQEHDGIFADIDSTNIDCADPRNLFLLVYRTTLRTLQVSQRTSYRMSMVLQDPARDRPGGMPEQMLNNLQNVAAELTINSAKIFGIKMQLDKMLASGEYDTLEYRVASWKTKPTLAACGITGFEGERRDPKQVAEETEAIGYPADPNMIIPGWIVVLPQLHGQIIVTASISGRDRYTAALHEGMPKTFKVSPYRGRNWTNLMSRKAITLAGDLAISTDHFLKLDDRQRDHLQKYLQIRSSREVTEKNLPNLLAYEKA